MMAAERPRSWMAEVGATTPRRPSVPGPLMPFDIASAQKTSRSQSYAMGQNRAVLAWQRGVAEATPGQSRDDTDLEKRKTSSASSYRPTFMPDLSPTDEKTVDAVTSYFENWNLESTDMNYCVVEFKAFRADIYRYSSEIYAQAGDHAAPISNGDIVVVEADRGYDLGIVIMITQSLVHANNYKNTLNEQHDKAELLASNRYAHVVTRKPLERPPPPSPSNPHARKDPREMPSNPEALKRVKRRANDAEIMALRDKEGLEMKAKRYCQTKAKDHRLDMEVVDAEFQHDYNKLTFYFVAPSYITFNNLVQDLFRQFKTRIWMSQIHVSSEFLQQPAPPPNPQPPPYNVNSPWNAPGTTARRSFNREPMYYPADNPNLLAFRDSSVTDTPDPVAVVSPGMTKKEQYLRLGLRPPHRILTDAEWEEWRHRNAQLSAE